MTNEAIMSWYKASAKSPPMEQIVVEVNHPEFIPGNRQLFLAGAHIRVYERSWTSCLLKPDTSDHSSVLIKANDFTSTLKDTGRIRVAFTYLTYPTGNLFALFVDFDTPPPSNCPSGPFVIFEDILGLDDIDLQERLLRAMDTRALNIALCEGGAVEESSDIFVSTSGIDVTYETTISLDPEACKALKQITDHHFSKHNRINSANRDFASSFQQLQNDLPLSKNPILDQSTNGVEGKSFWSRLIGFLQRLFGSSTIASEMSDTKRVKEIIRQSNGARDFLRRAQAAGFVLKSEDPVVGVTMRGTNSVFIFDVRPSYGHDTIFGLSINEGGQTVSLIDQARIKFEE